MTSGDDSTIRARRLTEFWFEFRTALGKAPTVHLSDKSETTVNNFHDFLLWLPFIRKPWRGPTRLFNRALEIFFARTGIEPGNLNSSATLSEEENNALELLRKYQIEDPIKSMGTEEHRRLHGRLREKELVGRLRTDPGDFAACEQLAVVNAENPIVKAFRSNVRKTRGGLNRARLISFGWRLIVAVVVCVLLFVLQQKFSGTLRNYHLISYSILTLIASLTIFWNLFTLAKRTLPEADLGCLGCLGFIGAFFLWSSTATYIGKSFEQSDSIYKNIDAIYAAIILIFLYFIFSIILQGRKFRYTRDMKRADMENALR